MRQLANHGNTVSEGKATKGCETQTEMRLKEKVGEFWRGIALLRLEIRRPLIRCLWPPMTPGLRRSVTPSAVGHSSYFSLRRLLGASPGPEHDGRSRFQRLKA